jgi:Putative addiction module component
VISTLVQFDHKASLLMRDIARTVISNIFVEKFEPYDDAILRTFYAPNQTMIDAINRDIWILAVEAVETRLAPMATRAEVEKLALDLPDTERAVLASHLLGSLPSVLHDEDEGVAEALRRDAEFEADPSHGMTLAELDRRIESSRSWCGLSFSRRSIRTSTR